MQLGNMHEHDVYSIIFVYIIHKNNKYIKNKYTLLNHSDTYLENSE